MTRSAPASPKPSRARATPSRLEALTPDPTNPREHTPRAREEVRASLLRVGAGRGIVLDEGDVVLAGNLTREEAAALGFRLKVVETDGRVLVAVQRRDLTPAEAAELAIRDNRAGEHSGWRFDVLATLVHEHGFTYQLLGFYPNEVPAAAEGLPFVPGPGHGQAGGDPDACTLTIPGVRQEDKDAILERVTRALDGTGLTPAAY